MEIDTLKHNFFVAWSDQLAYVLGYFLADGDLTINSRGSHYVNFTSTDLELLEKVRKLAGFSQRICPKKCENKKWKQSYRIQVGSKEIFSQICRLGFDKKNNKIDIEAVPIRYFRHFVRGFFDGDGSVSCGSYGSREKPSYILLVRFASGDLQLLKELLARLRKYARIKGGSVFKNSRGYHLSLSIRDSWRLFGFMYQGVPEREYLYRKYAVFLRAKQLWGRSSVGLEHMPVTHEIAGSSPVAPAMYR